MTYVASSESLSKSPLKKICHGTWVTGLSRCRDVGVNVTLSRCRDLRRKSPGWWEQSLQPKQPKKQMDR